MDKSEKRRGRPPEGAGKKGEPERIRDYPRVLITMRPATRSRLKIVADHEERSEWRIIDEALWLYFDELSRAAKAARATSEPRKA